MSKRKIVALLLLTGGYMLQLGCNLGLPRLGLGGLLNLTGT